jgi:lipoprotein-releasing system permease protein
MYILSYHCSPMFLPLPFFIGIRYTRAKRRNHFISFISLASMLGIALGVTVLITVLSVMNGFDYEIHSRVFGMARQVTVTNLSGGIKDWQQLSNKILQNKKLLAAAPYVSSQGMLSNAGAVNGVIITGILPESEQKVSNMPSRVVKGSMQALKPNTFGIVLGYDIAQHLGVTIGDKVVLITPEASMTPIGVMPRFKRFTVVGIFHVGEGFGYDSTAAYIHLNDAQKLFQYNKSVSGLNIKIQNLYDAPSISEMLTLQLPDDYNVSNWTDEYGPYFEAIRMEKTTMFVVLLFIIAIAAFNLVSSLVMTVTDKQADIAILRTLGVAPKTIMSIFIIQGGIIGFVGTLIGVAGGILLALNAPYLVKFLEHTFHTHFISAAIYFVDYLPSKLTMHDVWRIGVASLIMSLSATIYPAWSASRIQPAEALRYE